MILTRQDLSDAENVKSCAEEWRMATSTERVLAWAQNWGDAIIAGLNQSQDDESDAIADLKKEIGEIQDAHKAHLNEIQDAHVEAEQALTDLRKVIEQ